MSSDVGGVSNELTTGLIPVVDPIELLECFAVRSDSSKDWVFVKLVTRNGVVGWGECYTGRTRELGAIVALVESLRDYLVGRDVFAIKNFTAGAFADIAGNRGSMEFFCAVSGIETAMWDAVGKTVGQPIYNLLGGPCRDKIRVYANGWSYNPHGGTNSGDQAAETAKRLVERGFTALKFDPFVGPWRPTATQYEIEAAVDRFAQVRAAVGPRVDLLCETHRRLNPTTAMKYVKLLEPYNPYWFEEPVPSSNPEGLAEIRVRGGIPTVTGEDLYTKTAFRSVLAHRSADILNPDVASCGGILELLEIAAMADAYQVLISPHNNNSTTVGLAATMHACAVMPNFLITEYFVNFEERGNEFCDGFSVEDGYIALPTGPGLGIEVDEIAMRGFPRDGNRPVRTLSRFFGQ